MHALQPLRDDVARVTRRGVGMTLAAVLYWVGLAAVSAWSGLEQGPLGLFFLVATPLVYPLGWLLDRLFGGDLLARGHPLSGLILVNAATQPLGWPLMVLLYLRDPALLAFALAALLGAHFLPFGWLYRSPTYYMLGIAAVGIAAGLQVLWPDRAGVLIPAAMALCYAAAVAGVLAEDRARR